MTRPIVIRQERPDHAGVVSLLDTLDKYLGSLYAPQDNHILDVQALLASDVHFLVAVQGQDLVGCGAVRVMPAEAATDDAPYGEIKRMVVAPAARGKGVARALLAALEAHLSNIGLTQALLETGSAQTAAVALYERCGYARRGPFGGYPDNELSAFYAKSLTP